MSVASMPNDKSTLLLNAARQSGASRLSQPHRQPTMAEMKTRQLTKIRELKQALVDAGLVTLKEQGEALGLKRSTTWTVLSANYKSSGLSASIINRILEAPKLPLSVRDKILEYIAEKAAGLYGHGKMQRSKFIALLSTKHIERARLEEVVPLQPDAQTPKIR
jgi:hypothetical protein